MALKEFTNRKAVQLLATQSRRTAIEALELCDLHFEMGKLLAYEMLEDFELCDIEIKHVQGIKKGKAIVNSRDIVVVALLRAGLFAAQGIRSVFKECQFNLYEQFSETENDFNGKTVIIVDAVINTGKSMEKAVKHIQAKDPKKIIIATLILQKEAIGLCEKHPNIEIFALRVSENKYTGSGSTDTGNRLFNTKN